MLNDSGLKFTSESSYAGEYAQRANQTLNNPIDQLIPGQETMAPNRIWKMPFVHSMVAIGTRLS